MIFTINDLKEEVIEELNYRKDVYKKLIESGKMTKETANAKYCKMRAVLKILECCGFDNIDVKRKMASSK